MALHQRCVEAPGSVRPRRPDPGVCPQPTAGQDGAGVTHGGITRTRPQPSRSGIR
jgi:hypothetical protein